MVDVPQLVLNGLTVGGVYALGAVGLTLVYGILRLVNFAHGDLLTLGAYVAWTGIAGQFGLVPWQVAAGLAALAAVAVGWLEVARDRLRGPDRVIGAALVVGLAGVAALDVLVASTAVTILTALVVAAGAVAVVSLAVDRVLWTRLRDDDANLLTLMIVSIGVAFVLRHLLQLVYGADIRVFFRQSLGQAWTVRYYLSYLGLRDLRLTQVDVWIVGTALVLSAATMLVMRRTRIGKAMRALSDNEDLARVAGIDAERVVTYVWLLGGALAGIAGTLLAMDTTVHGNLGWRALLPLFAAVILGGVGSVPGALLGGFLIGLAQELSVPVLSAIGLDTGYKVAVGFLAMIVTLLVRPSGLMGVERT
jgi:branched-subunit amino acid ABC-type transport system permease component